MVEKDIKVLLQWDIFADFFIFDETPSGVDVGTKREVYGLLCRAVEWRRDPLIWSYLTEVYESAIAVGERSSKIGSMVRS
ncbi:hypothetical protein X727_24020 [Mesorhizobium sp. L103C119B0]|uniref:hypothetical protein n=1 Tax=Mesorhizobium sp. L103C119B0 TaxID=1287085 RepID=UPI0003D01EFD|nr:hypothetical protein [Mesorhizobium sp. L103C119B0]ESZ67908.1 hypothetical protein X727_24020 [Mesorhizobium sp. L103C119B0]